MDENRLQSYFKNSPAAQFKGDQFMVVQSPWEQLPLQIIKPADLYQAAYQKAKEEYELNRLFNPDYYEEGGGI